MKKVSTKQSPAVKTVAAGSARQGKKVIAGAQAIAGRSLRVWQVENGARQHRLSHRSERHYYSVPYALAHSEVEVHLTSELLEVLHRGTRVASHARSYEPGKATTLAEHMPKAHQKYVGRTPSRLIEDAQQIGPLTGQLVEAILAAKRHPEMGFRSCLGILRLAKTYPAERMEAAAQRALRARAYNFQSLDSILKNQLDHLPGPDDNSNNPPLRSTVEHDNIRGAGYFDSPPEAEPPVIQ